LIYLYILGLFNDAASDYIKSNGSVINELEATCRKAVMDYFKAISQHLFGRTQERHDNPSQNSLSPDQDLNLQPPEY
jgi:hypothetical protein